MVELTFISTQSDEVDMGMSYVGLIIGVVAASTYPFTERALNLWHASQEQQAWSVRNGKFTSFLSYE